MYQHAVKALAPCGLDCSRCASYKDGEIIQLSKALQEKLQGYEKLAVKTASFIPAYKGYAQFMEVLKLFSEGSCPGCRCGESVCKCPVNDCHKAKGVDFCFQCKSFPCTKDTMMPSIKTLWEQNNMSMKEQGVENYYQASLEKPRY